QDVPVVDQRSVDAVLQRGGITARQLQAGECDTLAFRTAENLCERRSRCLPVDIAGEQQRQFLIKPVLRRGRQGAAHCFGSPAGCSTSWPRNRRSFLFDMGKSKLP